MPKNNPKSAPPKDRLGKDGAQVTVWGVRLKFTPAQFEDYEFIEALAALDESTNPNPIYLVRVVNTVAGNSDKKLAEIKNAIRKKRGHLLASDMAAFIQTFFKRLEEIAPNSSRSA